MKQKQERAATPSCLKFEKINDLLSTNKSIQKYEKKQRVLCL